MPAYVLLKVMCRMSLQPHCVPMLAQLLKSLCRLPLRPQSVFFCLHILLSCCAECLHNLINVFLPWWGDPMQTPLLTDQFFIFFIDAALLFFAELIPLIRFWPFCFPIEVIIPGAAATKEALFLTCLPDRTACMNFMHKAPWHGLLISTCRGLLISTDGLINHSA